MNAINLLPWRVWQQQYCQKIFAWKFLGTIAISFSLGMVGQRYLHSHLQQEQIKTRQLQHQLQSLEHSLQEQIIRANS